MSTISEILGEKAAPRNVEVLIAQILEEYTMHKKFLLSSLKHITEEELTHLGKYLEFCKDSGFDINYMTQCYLTIVEDTMREQIYFMMKKEYRHKCFADVAGDVYFNNDYMNRYMFGLAITSFLWSNHIDMIRFFKQTLPREKGGKYIEIGPGHGYYLMTAIKLASFDEYLGIDISENSISQTKAIIEYFHPGLKTQVQLEIMDFLNRKDLLPNSFDAIVMGEVLEHVERPEEFLSQVAKLAKPDAYIFITTCLNAPAVDHIYLWRSANELEDMIRENGLNIKKSLYLPYEGNTIEETTKKGLAINIAYLLKKV